MRYELLLRYHARVFLSGAGRYPATLPVELAGAIAPGVWMSQTVNQIEVPRGLSFQRSRLTSTDGQWAIDLPGQSIDLTYSGAQVDLDLTSFSEAAGSYLSAMTEACGEKATRMALVQEGFLAESGIDAHLRLMRLPPLFQRHPPFEWDWRCAATIQRPVGDLTEDTNTIVTVRRMTAIRQDTGHLLDTIRLDLDINTAVSPVTGTAAPRFGRTEVAAFFASCPGWHESLASEILPSLVGVPQ